MISINAQDFLNAIESAAVGAGKGFVLIIDPTERDIGNGKKAQLASISSSDGTKTGLTNFYIKTDETKERMVSVCANLRPAVMSLAKITDLIHMELKDTYLKLTDVKEEAQIRVELLEEQDIVLELPNNSEDAIAITINREKFIAAVRMGGYCAGDNLATPGFDCICFRVDAQAKELWVTSIRTEMVCRAIVPIEAVYDPTNVSMQWHLVNHRFIQKTVAQLLGDQIQIAFNLKYMVVQCATGLFASKKSEGNFAEAYNNLLSDVEYDFCGKVVKKNLLTGMEIAMVGAEESCIMFETNENGTLKITRFNGENKATVVQKEHEGMMQKTCYGCEFLKMIIACCKDEELYYFGKKGVGKEHSFLKTSGESEGVRYNAVLAPINR